MELNKTSARELIETQIASNKVVVYSKSYCPYCARTKALLKELGVQFLVVELDQLESGDVLQEALADLTGKTFGGSSRQHTVPNVFIHGKFVGGNSDLQVLHKRASETKAILRQKLGATDAMLPALSTKPKQAVRQVKGLTNDSIDAYSNTPMGGSAMTSYADNTIADSGGGGNTARASPPSTSKPVGASNGRTTSRKGHDEGSHGGGVLARVVRDRKASGEEELSLKAGDVVRVLSAKRTGYLKCEFADEIGYVPSSYLEFFDESGGGTGSVDADGTIEENQRAEKRKKKKDKRRKDKKQDSSDPEDSTTVVGAAASARSPRKAKDADAGVTGDEGDVSPRKSKKKGKSLSSKHHHHRHVDDDGEPLNTKRGATGGIGEDTERRKAKKPHKKKHHHHDSNEASSESDDDNGGSRSHRKGRRHRSRRRGHGRGGADSGSESSSSYYSSSDSGYSRRRRRHRHRKASSSEDDDYDTGDKRKSRHRGRHRERGSGDSDAEDGDSTAPSARRSDKKRLEAEATTPRGAKPGKDKESTASTNTTAATAVTSSVEKSVGKLEAHVENKGSSRSEVISDHTPEEATKKTSATASSSTTKDGGSKSARTKKDDESRTESSVAAQKAKTNLGKQIGEKMRSLLGGGKKTERSHKSSSGILNACPGTTQGEEGWYEHGENERYYFVLLDGKWSLLYGPMTEEDFELYSTKVLDQNRMVELPPTYLHKAGYFLNQELRVQKV